jgi:hypothetical protein
MSLSAARWHVIAESNFAWEREALDWLRSNLPDRDSWHVWTNFEFIDDEGKVSEVDALVLSPAGLFLVEIKSRPGVLRGDAHSWTWTTDGRSNTYDNPVILANRKAKRLASLLRRQTAIAKAKIRLPFVEPAIFLSSTSLSCQLEGLARTATFQHGRPGTVDDPGIVGALANGITNRATTTVDAAQARAIARGLAEAGIRPSNKHRQVGDYRLTKLLAEGEGFQDWEASHVSIDTVHRRVRIYTVATASSPEIRATRVRQARREFEILAVIDHPGILKLKDYKETELGPALRLTHPLPSLARRPAMSVLPSPLKSPARAEVHRSAVDQVPNAAFAKADPVLLATCQAPVDGLRAAMSARLSPSKSPVTNDCQGTLAEKLPQSVGVAVPLAGVVVTHQLPSAARLATSVRPSPLKSPVSMVLVHVRLAGSRARVAVVDPVRPGRVMISSFPAWPMRALDCVDWSRTVKLSSTASAGLKTDSARTVTVASPGMRAANASCRLPLASKDGDTTAALLVVTV